MNNQARSFSFPMKLSWKPLGIALAILTICCNVSWAQGKKALPKTINTEADEFAPILSPSGRLLYFVRANHPGNKGGADKGHDIWKSLSRQNDWKAPENLGRPVNDLGDNGIGGISSDGNTIYLTNIYDDQARATGPGISSAQRLGTKWRKPETLWDASQWPINNSFGFYITSDQNLAILFANDTTQGAGQEDLYVLRKQGDTWLAPLNLGKAINTEGLEFAPFLTANTKQLFFASTGHKGLGSADIFVSNRLDDTWTNWSAPLNLGPEVNTTDFDAYFATDTAGITAYFSSAPNENALGDLYQIALADIPALQEKKTPPAIDSLAVAVITEEIAKDTTNPVAVVIDTVVVKQEEVLVVATDQPKVDIIPKEPIKTADPLLPDTVNTVASTTIISVVSEEAKKAITPPKYEETFKQAVNRADTVFEHMLFGFNEYKLATQERYKAQYLVDFMQKHTQTAIKLNGHTDDIGSDSINVIFGNARCVSIKNYMVSLGIAPHRIQTYSYGEKKPLADKNKQALNRRVEVFLLKPED